MGLGSTDKGARAPWQRRALAGWALRALLGLLGASCSAAPRSSACPAGSAIGSELACRCGDRGSIGVTVCQANGSLSDCMCPTDGGVSGAGGLGGLGGGGGGGGGGGVGGIDTGGTGGMSGAGGTGTGGTGGGSTGMGGDGGTTMSGDGDGDRGGDGDGDGEGAQGAVCDSNGDCDDDLECYDPGERGRGVCSEPCEDDDDCEDLDDADWTCSQSTGLCHVECLGADDEASCPEPLVCTLTASFGGGGSYRCKHPGDEPEPKGAFEPCAQSDECEGELSCYAPGANATGYCTLGCQNGCQDLDWSGAIAPTCVTPFPPTGAVHCGFDCSANMNGCPDGMRCVQYSPFFRCAFD